VAQAAPVGSGLPIGNDIMQDSDQPARRGGWFTKEAAKPLGEIVFMITTQSAGRHRRRAVIADEPKDWRRWRKMLLSVEASSLHVSRGAKYDGLVGNPKSWAGKVRPAVVV
jgi:hypothetical protein